MTHSINCILEHSGRKLSPTRDWCCSASSRKMNSLREVDRPTRSPHRHDGRFTKLRHIHSTSQFPPQRTSQCISMKDKQMKATNSWRPSSWSRRLSHAIHGRNLGQDLQRQRSLLIRFVSLFMRFTTWVQSAFRRFPIRKSPSNGGLLNSCRRAQTQNKFIFISTFGRRPGNRENWIRTSPAEVHIVVSGVDQRPRFAMLRLDGTFWQQSFRGRLEPANGRTVFDALPWGKESSKVSENLYHKQYSIWGLCQSLSLAAFSPWPDFFCGNGSSGGCDGGAAGGTASRAYEPPPEAAMAFQCLF